MTGPGLGAHVANVERFIAFAADHDGAHVVFACCVVQHEGRAFGTFEFVPAGNRYGLPDFYELHAWLWNHNTSGMFNDWNPAVVCP